MVNTNSSHRAQVPVSPQVSHRVSSGLSTGLHLPPRCPSGPCPSGHLHTSLGCPGDSCSYRNSCSIPCSKDSAKDRSKAEQSTFLVPFLELSKQMQSLLTRSTAIQFGRSNWKTIEFFQLRNLEFNFSPRC